MIDFSPNNAPLQSLARPSLDDIARLRETDTVSRWTPPPPVAPRRAALGNLLLLVFCLALAPALTWTARHRPAEGGEAPWMQRHDIRSIYVAARAPSVALVDRLTSLAAQGADVRLVSGRPLSIPGATVGVVVPAHIEREGVMINGLSFYPLDL